MYYPSQKFHIRMCARQSRWVGNGCQASVIRSLVIGLLKACITINKNK